MKNKFCGITHKLRGAYPIHTFIYYSNSWLICKARLSVCSLKSSAFGCNSHGRKGFNKNEKKTKKNHILKSESLIKYVCVARMQNVSVNQKCLAADEKRVSLSFFFSTYERCCYLSFQSHIKTFMRDTCNLPNAYWYTLHRRHNISAAVAVTQHTIAEQDVRRRRQHLHLLATMNELGVQLWMHAHTVDRQSQKRREFHKREIWGREGPW